MNKFKIGLLVSVIIMPVYDAAWGQTAGDSSPKSCVQGLVSIAQVSDFRRDPATLLSRFPLGDGLTKEVRDLVASDTTVLSSAISLVAQANSAQKVAIAAGLAQAAIACNRVSPVEASLIQQAVAGMNDSTFQTAFAAASGNFQTTAVGAPGGAGGGASSTGSLTGGALNNGTPISFSTTPQAPFSLFVPGTGGVVNSGGFTNGGTSVTSISPFTP